MTLASLFQGRTTYSQGLLEQCAAFIKAKSAAVDAAQAEIMATGNPVVEAMEAPSQFSMGYCVAAYDHMLLCRAKTITNTIRTIYGQTVREANES